MKEVLIILLCVALLGCATKTTIECGYPPIPAELMQQRVPFMSIESYVALHDGESK